MQTFLDFGLCPPQAPGDRFHPAVEDWLRQRFGRATEVQERAWAVTAQQRHALIAAPTGSGKTLAAFLSAINDLVIQGLRGGLSDQVQVLYISPLKALSNDIQKNLQEPLAGIRARLSDLGLPDVGIRDAVRTGDTSAIDRERMRRQPPHILVTTPESLFILMTSDSGRAMLGGVRSIIVDELHALAGSKRGAHLLLTLERLEALCATPPTRIGLSATVKPLEEMGRYLVGEGRGAATIVDAGHVRDRDLALELPRAPLTTVMANEVWGELYDRLAELSRQHRTTLIFVNQRRTAERVARHLAERIGDEHVTAHHGSLAKEHRLDAETRLKQGRLKALVATSALELGIDIGDIDLVCQLGSPRAINAFLQRVGRAGHAIGATPKGRLFPLSLDDLLECAALLDAVRRGELDRIRVPQQPLDVLAQQIVAETAAQEWSLDALYARLRQAASYAALDRHQFEQLVQMLADGYTTRRGRRGAHLHYDAVNRVIRARRGARLTVLMNGGVIPDQFDSDVVLLPEEVRIGTIGEDFAFESIPGDIFQLGNNSYRIAKVETGRVLVEDAAGQPPNVPFWFGDALGRSDELCAAVARLNAEAGAILGDDLEAGVEDLSAWLQGELALPAEAAQQLALYLGASKAALGALPTATRVIFERFFDEVGDSHLVIHSPFGSRINKAWGLALRKRFCRKFNFELQASALEDSIVLSLGPTHSFPLLEIKDYLKSTSARDVLIQALLDAPMFGTRFRWNATNALAVRRMQNGRKVPPQFQRSDAEDLLTVVFPDQVACLENISGPREIPDHPLVQQTVHDCLTETMDVVGFERLLGQLESGEIEVLACDLAAPSPLAHAILNARPYAFLDDGEAEERRTRAVNTNQPLDLRGAADLARLDPAVIRQVCEEAWPEIGSHEELHDALLMHGFLTEDELGAQDPMRAQQMAALRAQKRATILRGGLAVAAERLHELLAIDPALVADIAPLHPAPESRELALREILRNRMELLGPISEAQLAAPLRISTDDARGALLELEAEGAVMRGSFTHPALLEWCERRLLARMHRLMRDRKRAEIQPVSPAQFLRFLFQWHRVGGDSGDDRREGEGGLLAALRQLEGCNAAAAAWEEELLPARLAHYAPQMLDRLCASGHVAWYRPPGSEEARRKAGPVRATPILLCERETLPMWQSKASFAVDELPLSSKARQVHEALLRHGASFFDDLVHDAGLIGAELETALGELVSQGLVTCDSFAGLRALVMPAEKRQRLRRRFGRGPNSLMADLDHAGRWSLARLPRRHGESGALAAPEVEHIARTLLRRYGVVFRKLIEREEGLPPWRELFYVYRRMEARDEVRGGRFVSGFAGEQFALPEAAAALRKLQREAQNAEPRQERVSISAADPLNLVGILTPGEKVPRLPGNRILFENGVPIAVQSGGEVRYLRPQKPEDEWDIRMQLIRRPAPQVPNTAPPRSH